MNSTFLGKRLIIITCLILSGSSLLWGQDSNDDSVLMLEEVTVTVNKYKEKAAEVSASLTSISANEIAERDIKTIEDIHKTVPSLYIYNSGMPAYENKIGMRGHINQRTHIDPSLVVYIDDMPLTMYTEFSAGFSDAEKIEVLRGPQSTLYGVNAESGIINITTETNLDDEWGGKAGVTLGSYNQKAGKLKLSVPIIEGSVYLNASFGKQVQDSYVTNKFFDEPSSKQDSTNFRLKLNWLFSDSLDFQFISYQSEQDNTGGSSYVPLEYKDAGLDKYELAYNTEGFNKSKTLSNAFKINWSTDHFLVKSITTVSDHEASYENDFDGTATSNSFQYVGAHETTNQTSTQEIRISSPDDNDADLRWIAGLAYSSGTRTEDAYNYYYYYGLSGPAITDHPYDNKLIKEDQAAFAQISYKMLNKRLGLLAGLRSETAKREIDTNEVANYMAVITPTFKDSKTESKTLHKATIDFKTSENSKIFFTNAQGWRAGGFNYIHIDGVYNEYDSEESTTNELGFKYSSADLGLQFSTVYFSTEIKDFQVQITTPTNYIYLSNAETAKMSGLEIEALASPSTLVDLSFNYSQVEAEFTDYKENGTDYSGNKVPHTPAHEAYLGIKFKPFEDFFVKLEAMNTGMFYFDRTNDEDGKQEAIQTYNLMSQYKIGDLKLAASIKNLTNEYYYTDGMTNQLVGWIGVPGAPMTMQLKAEYDF